MAGPEGPGIWGKATAEEIAAALRGVRVSLATEDSSRNYTASINHPLNADLRDVTGLRDADLYANGALSDLLTGKERVSAAGEPASLDLRIGENDPRWYRVWIGKTKGNGSGSGLISAALDISELKAAEEHLRLALLELAHRSKNLLAVVLSIARQSAEESATLESFSARFVGRIRSLALAHDVLTDESWRGGTLFSLLRSQLSAFSEEAANQSTIDGHNAYLKPNAVQYVGLALHELLAMSVLSGALSTPLGRLAVTSTLVAPDPYLNGAAPADLILSWHETGFPGAKPMESSRFGHALLEEIVPTALGGSARLVRHDGVLTYELRIPATQFF